MLLSKLFNSGRENHSQEILLFLSIDGIHFSPLEEGHSMFVSASAYVPSKGSLFDVIRYLLKSLKIFLNITVSFGNTQLLDLLLFFLPKHFKGFNFSRIHLQLILESLLDEYNPLYHIFELKFYSTSIVIFQKEWFQHLFDGHLLFDVKHVVGVESYSACQISGDSMIKCGTVFPHSSSISEHRHLEIKYHLITGFQLFVEEGPVLEYFLVDLVAVAKYDHVFTSRLFLPKLTKSVYYEFTILAELSPLFDVFNCLVSSFSKDFVVPIKYLVDFSVTIHRNI